MNNESNAAVDRTVRSAQIIGAALALGVAVFLVVTLFVRQNRGANPLFTYMGVIFAVMAAAAGIIVPRMTSRAGVKSVAEAPSMDALAGVFLTQSIIRGALIEGAAFCNAVFFMIFGDWINFGVAAVLCALLVIQIPTRDRFLAWLQRQREADL